MPDSLQNQIDRGHGKEPLLRPSSRRRTAIFLGVTLGGYLLVNLFWQYLTSGTWGGGVDVSPQTYHRALTAPMGQLFLRPLSIFTHPWMILVTGLLLGVVIFVPIILAMLYRMAVAGAFIFVAAVIGHAPVLALTLVLGCLLASRTKLRSDMPIVAFLLGLLPVGLYLYLLSYAGGDSAATLPLQRWVPYAPLTVAVVSSVLAACGVLGLAKLTKYRPGVVLPVLAMLSIWPAAIFYLKIGPAELDYAVIVNRLEGGSLVAPVVAEVWAAHNGADGLDDQQLQERAVYQMQQRRWAFISMCDRFVGDHGDNWRAASVLCLKAQALSLQLDQSAFAQGTIRFSDAYVLPESQKAWTELADRYPESAQAGLASFFLAQLALRQQDAALADRLLQSATKRLTAVVAQFAAAQAGAPTNMFNRLPSRPAQADYEQALAEAQRLAWLMETNRVLEDPAAAEAMAALLSINELHQFRHDQIRLLLDVSAGRALCRMGNNLKLAMAVACEDLYQGLPVMNAIAQDSSDADAAIEANFHLGQLAKRRPELVKARWCLTPEEHCRRIVELEQASPSTNPNPYRARAQQWLPSAQPATASAPGK